MAVMPGCFLTDLSRYDFRDERSSSPCTFDLKDKANAFEAWGGLSACQNSVDAMFDAAVLGKGFAPTARGRLIRVVDKRDA